MEENITTGFTCNKCGRVFDSKEEFAKIHKEEINNEEKKDK